MATIAAPAKLNPQAPEFFPHYQTPHPLYSYCLPPNPPIFQSPNPTPCIYYAPSFLQFPNTFYADKQPFLVSPNPHPELTSLDEASHEPAHSVAVSPRAEKQGGTKRENRYKRRQGFGYRRNARSFCGGSIPNNKHPVLSVQPNGHKTTVMIRNIPNRYTRELLMEFLDNHCMQENEKVKKLWNSETTNDQMSAFDFLYLPMDFEKKANKGYAFVNFTNPQAVWKFKAAVENRRWSRFQSNKICRIAYARLQGKEELVRHFHSSSFGCESDDYLPVSFSPPRDGAKTPVKIKIIGRRIGKPNP